MKRANLSLPLVIFFANFAMLQCGDIVSMTDFPLATGGSTFKFALVINSPANFGGNAIIMELTTHPDPNPQNHITLWRVRNLTQ
jgi:hypothetical protein